MEDIHMLIVDQHFDDLVLFAQTMKESENACRISSCSTAQHALEYMEDMINRHDSDELQLAVIDIDFEERYGLIILEVLKQSNTLRYIPVVVFSRRADLFGKAYFNYANACIQKPDDPEEFKTRVKEIWHYWTNTVMLEHYQPEDASFSA